MEASEPHDAEFLALLARARSGDRAAGAALFERLRDPLLARIRWMMGPEARQIAESGDFLQETFATALTATPSTEIREANSYLRWLTAIARNRIRHEVRRHREQALSQLTSALGERVPAAPEEPISVDAALTLMEAMAELAPEERRILELRELEGLTFVAIGELLGRSDRHAHRLHAQALMRLSRRFRGRPRGGEIGAS